MLNISKLKKTAALVLSIVLVLSFWTTAALAAETTFDAPMVAMTTDNELSFSNLDSLKVGECIEFDIIDSEGNPATIGVERVDLSADGISTRATENSWKVYFTGVTINSHFYMTVSNNKVTSVYDEWIMIIGGTYDNASLTKTSTYGKLSFKVEAYAGIMAASCWLKGTVTGNNNNISVTWQM